ncbi:MAG TPA: nuclear transport factor 2 family protein [Candidatus Limnocylindrales bacterium]|nr:nuclear transport factor 2 family protein [Candidatus Limnocylindrales bacterium]
MNEHPNAALVRDLFRAFAQADLATIERIIPDDAVWEFPGRTGALAGRHEGRQAILGFLMNVTSLSAGTFGLDLEDVVANERHAIALFRGHATRNGKTLSNPTCLKMRIQDGQITRLKEFVWNLYEVDDFWS